MIMRLITLLCALIVTMVLATPVGSQCPRPGTYATFTGTIAPGRASEAWCGDGGPGRPDNTENAHSWNGAALGTQWVVWGMCIDESGASEVGRSIDGFGNGWIDYETNYLGGQFRLSKDHLWGDGMHDLEGHITYYNVSTRVSYVGGQPVGATSNVFFTGVFDACPDYVLQYVITNAMQIWRSDSAAPRPDGYPAMLCNATTGELFDVCCIQATIHNVVATDESSWGEIKGLYK
jgi:hypothetical protein